MDEQPEILLTNDDGIDAPGLAALDAGLSTVADVTVVAPATDQSKVGRQTSTDVVIEKRNGGIALTGTPADCVIAGLQEFCPDPDLVVAGCNRGANLGGYVLGRSGTVSAAVEAAFHGVPSIASSLYVPVDDVAFEDAEVEERDFREAVRATCFLVEHALDAGVFDHADYLNVNAPVPNGHLAATESVDVQQPATAPAPMRITSPSHRYEMDAIRDGDQLRLHDRIWELMAEGDLEESPGTDRHAVLDGAVSVSPLTAPHTTEHHEALDGLAAAYPPEQ
ncbi:5'/3'-nucleotidase SurE [Salinarchaeum laminariae]|uniref:5'/3'-nucleotidase SurE n=1 Tax=Salinarchaeum laminariae TaxID=869888 RepID=UPI0020BF1DF6|nr:5'/3'-nucleotidase SurE [Salinarchaeum laminariae]